MSRSIPLIRAAALAPMIRWMHANGRPAERRLAAADLAYVSLDAPYMPVPLVNVAAFFRDAGRAEGPDIGCRVVSQASILELAMIGKVALGARTPREAIMRVAAALPYHCSHEHIQIGTVEDRMQLVEGWSMRFDNETLHIIQQFVAAIIGVIGASAGAAWPQLSRVEIVPHPEAGIEHLKPWLGPKVFSAASRTLVVQMDRAVADHPFAAAARDRRAQLALLGMKPLNAAVGLSGAARLVIAAMIETNVPTLERLSVASGLSKRTFQRCLAEEGTSLTELLDEIRRDIAMAQLGASEQKLAAFGCVQKSALARAVKRRTGNAPSKLRIDAADQHP